MLDRIRRWVTPFHIREASLCFPALPLLVGGTLIAGKPALAATLGGAAFAVGFGAGRGFAAYRWFAMLVPLLGMPLATFVGCLSAHVFPLYLMLAVLLGAGVAALALFDEDWWWMILQMVIAFLVSLHFAGDFREAGQRATAVFAGGLVQFVLVGVLALAFNSAAQPYILAPRPAPPLPSHLVAHIVRAALSVAASIVLAHWYTPGGSFWAPMTALLVLKPGLLETRVRGTERLTGTLIGCLLATLFAAAGADNGWWLTLGLSLGAVSAYALQKANYGVLTTAITFTIVLLSSIGGVDAITNAEHRIVATLLGGGLALLAASLFAPVPRRRSRRDQIGSL